MAPRRFPPLFKKQNRDSIIGKSDLCVAGTSAHDRGMVFAGLDSLFEQVRERLRGRASRNAGRRKGRDFRHSRCPGRRSGARRSYRSRAAARATGVSRRRFPPALPRIAFPPASEKSSTANKTPLRSATAIPTESSCASSRFARCGGEFIHCWWMLSALGPSATFSASELKRAPACEARSAIPGSPGSWCERVFCAAMRSACWRAAPANVALHFKGRKPMRRALVVRGFKQGLGRVFLLAASRRQK